MKVHTSETAVLVVFAVTLIGCILAGIPILAALALGYLIFFAYTLSRGYTVRDILGMSWKGIKTAKNILITFLLIGMLTALWRAAGTIPAIVSYCAGLMNPAVMILMAFLLNCLISFLTGTAFGTAATMGVICMTMAKAMGCNEILAGGAILSGVFFGDRCSPVSTSALLVAELTHTNIFDNIRLMVKTAFIPTLLTCGFYGICGILFPAVGSGSMALADSFAGVFVWAWFRSSRRSSSWSCLCFGFRSARQCSRVLSLRSGYACSGSIRIRPVCSRFSLTVIMLRIRRFHP